MLRYKDISLLAGKEDTVNLRLNSKILNKVYKHNILKSNKMESDSKNSSSAPEHRKK